MSKSLLTAVVIVVIIVLGIIWFISKASSSRPAGEETATTTPEALEPSLMADGEYILDPVATTVNWKGTKTFIEGYKDTGTLKIKAGSFAVLDGVITAGTIDFDTASIAAAATSNTGLGIGDLTKHLKSADFLNVAKYPTASFALTKAEPVGGSNGGMFIFTGDLTIKDITKEFQFPVSFSENAEGQAVVTGEFTIDRTDWDIRYGSGKFFQNLGDKTIADEVEVKFEAVAEK